MAVAAAAHSGMDSVAKAILLALISGSVNDSGGMDSSLFLEAAGIQARITACHRWKVHESVSVAVGRLLRIANSHPSM